MARRFLAALALAHGAASLLDEYFVDVVVNVDVFVPPDLAKVIANAADAAGSDAEGRDACVTVDAIMSNCYYNGVLDTEPTEAANCLCCDSKTAISSDYSVCADYLSSEGATASSAYVAISGLYDLCSLAGGGVCTSTRAQGTTKTAVDPGTVTVPAACSSMVSIYNSCYSKMDGFETARASDAASCFCHDSSGESNTKFEDYASSCAPWARTYARSDYIVITRFEHICEAYLGATASDKLSLSIVSTRSDMLTGLPTLTKPTTSPTSEPTGDAGNAENTTTGTGNAAPGGAVPGLVAWIANLTTFVLSFFILI